MLLILPAAMACASWYLSRLIESEEEAKDLKPTRTSDRIVQPVSTTEQDLDEDIDSDEVEEELDVDSTLEDFYSQKKQFQLIEKQMFPTKDFLSTISTGDLDKLTLIKLKVNTGELTGIQMQFESGVISPLV